MSELEKAVTADLTELKKLLATVGERQTIHEFALWLILERGIDLGQAVDLLVEDYLGLNTATLDQESLELELATDYPNGRQP
jgi:hypothetical protein